MHAFVETLENFAPVVWQASWQAACVAILVWAAVTILGNRISARWRFALWSLVFVRMALPMAPVSPTSVFRFAQRAAEQGEHAIARETTTVSQPPTGLAIERGETAFIDEDDGISIGLAEESSEIASAGVLHTSHTLPKPEADGQSSWTWTTTASVLWLIGATLLLLRRIRQQLLLAGRARNWRPIDDRRVESLVASCCRRLHVRARVAVLLNDDQAGPAITGIFRTRIVMPQSVLAGCSDEQLEMILLHELAHLRRHDLLWHEAFLLLRAVHWFNPAAWWAYHRLHSEREMACDEMVLESAGSDRRQSYGLTLLQIVQRQSAPILSPGLLGTTDQSARLQRRLVMIRDYRKRTWKSAFLATAAAVLIAALGLTSPPAAHTQDSSDAGKEKKIAAPQASSFELAGHCLDDAGKPIAGAEVLLFYFESQGATPKQKWQQKTGATGEFRFERLKPLADAQQQEYYLVAARKPKHTTSVRLVFAGETPGDLKLPLSTNVGALTGRVTDEKGAPLAGVEVFLPIGVHPLAGVLHDVTDKDGRYSIADMKCWNADDTVRFDPKSGTRERIAHCYFQLKHPDYPLTTGQYDAIPQEVNVQLKPGIIIEGRVLDVVTGKPAAGASVAAQGLKERGFDRVVTDDKGAYRLSLTPDRYNIWAEAKDRTAAALDSFEAPVGEVTKAPDLKLVAGGFIAGRVVDKATGKPMVKLPGGHAVRVANYGPARPSSGGAVEGTVVQEDGTYRLRVAPGPNHPYLMNDMEAERTPRNVRSLPPIVVGEGETVTLDFHVALLPEEPKALDVTTAERTPTRPGAARPAPSTKQRIGRDEHPIRKRPETAVGKLLNKLDELRPKAGDDEWATVLRDLIQLGPAAVPELIAEMDATNNEYMLRCLGFVMRGIGDKRAVPALIRALPKTCVTARSDMGYIAKDPDLRAFMQKHDTDDGDEFKERYYSFGRAVNEFRVALQKLTGATHGENEIVYVFLEGSPRQQFLQRSLYQRCAERWAAWWEKNWKDFVADESYATVNLRPLTEPPPAPARFPHGPQITVDSHGNHLLESVRNPQAQTVFHDFDTGRKSALPERLRAPANEPERLDDILAWAAQEGFDVMGSEYTPPGSDKPHYVLRGLGLVAWQIETNRWETLDNELQGDQPPAFGRSSGGLLARFDPAKGQYVPAETATFLFRTREGGHGAIFVGVEVYNDRLKPGTATSNDELSPIAFRKGRRFAYKLVAEHTAQNDSKGAASR